MKLKICRIPAELQSIHDHYDNIIYTCNHLFLQINSVFGKCLENVRSYRTIKVVKSAEQAKRYINRDEMNSFSIIASNLVVIELSPTVVKLCKPVYAGMVSFLCDLISN